MMKAKTSDKKALNTAELTTNRRYDLGKLSSCWLFQRFQRIQFCPDDVEAFMPEFNTPAHEFDATRSVKLMIARVFT